MKKIMLTPVLFLLVMTSSISKSRSIDLPTYYCKYAVVCLYNNTPYNITYNIQWGNGAWKSWTLYPGETMRHWYTYETGDNCTSPNLSIEFDFDTTSRVQNNSYALVRYQSSSNDCSDAKHYEFQCTSSNCYYIDLYSTN
ncbi:MAG TPA: hypothetical protein PKA00_04070 [Saprospiraceae bacterium]|nr:hypothetical protein [Saprospiraceae bacterium]HMQ82055.1 hypothetical protein [Saprospiraceae bacterium]